MSMIQIPVALRGAGPAPFVAEDGGGPVRTSECQAVSPFLATGHALFARSKTAGAVVGSDQLGQRIISQGTMKGIAGGRRSHESDLAVLRKDGVIRHLALQTEPTKPAAG